MALSPVCMGSLTDSREMIPGALMSTRRRLSVLIGPFPSMGLPRPSTTLPKSSSPTGTSTMAPVLLTVSPSLMFCRYRTRQYRRCPSPSSEPYLSILIRIPPSLRPGCFSNRGRKQYRHQWSTRDRFQSSLRLGRFQGCAVPRWRQVLRSWQLEQLRSILLQLVSLSASCCFFEWLWKELNQALKET